jgi:hypothetical protein
MDKWLWFLLALGVLASVSHCSDVEACRKAGKTPVKAASGTVVCIKEAK